MENCNAPVELVDGFVGRIEVHVPWTALTVENTHLQVKNLELTLQPKQRDDSLGWYFLVGTTALELSNLGIEFCIARRITGDMQ